MQSIDGSHFPSNWTNEQVKAKFDQLPAYVAARLNALIDALLSKVPGSNECHETEAVRTVMGLRPRGIAMWLRDGISSVRS